MKLLILGLLAVAAFAQDHNYFIMRRSAAELRMFLPGVDPLARDTIQVYVQVQKPESTEMAVTLTTRRNGVDRTTTEKQPVNGGWVMVPFFVDEVFTGLDITGIKFEETVASVTATSAAKAPLRVIR